MNKRVTLRDIARKLGVDHSTVSLALKNHQRISLAMREKVREAAREMGYVPDPMLAALSHYRHGKVSSGVQAELAWLNHWPDPKQLRRYREFDFYWKGAEQAGLQSGYRLVEYAWQTPAELRRVQGILIARNVRGILIPPQQGNEIDWGDFRWNLFSVVRFGYSISNLPVQMVTSDHVGASLLAVEKMTRKNYQRIGYVGSDSVGRHFLYQAGFLQAQSHLPASRRVPILFIEEEDASTGEHKLLAWMETYRPDAIITFMATLPARLKNLGFRIPEDVGLAAFSIYDGNANAGINQHPEEIGRFAMETLISQINHDHRGIPESCRIGLVQSSWVDGSDLPDRSVA